MQCNPCQTKTIPEQSPVGAKPIKNTYTKCGCRNATALQRIGCRAVVPRKPHIIHSRIANADTHGFRIANSEELGTGGIVTGKSGLSAQSYPNSGRGSSRRVGRWDQNPGCMQTSHHRSGRPTSIGHWNRLQST